MHDLQNPRTVAYWAAHYEAAQALRDSSAAWAAFQQTGQRVYSPEDYALWSAHGYAVTAAYVVRDLPVWEAAR